MSNFNTINPVDSQARTAKEGLRGVYFLYEYYVLIFVKVGKTDFSQFISISNNPINGVTNLATEKSMTPRFKHLR
ncbi:MAG: hypothetical protein LBD63_01980 [Mycoplasmataceae bacterium]|jgi:hypothetical protein|nr:hypothetical protein [Mycoplasmataceae bacterium]